jgi:hypothetical protein
MARFSCREFNEEGTFVCDRRHECPNYGSHKVQLALSIGELPEDVSAGVTALPEENGSED